MRLFINSLAASAGGGLTYIRNVIPHLAATPGLEVSVAATPAVCAEFGDFPNIGFLEIEASGVRRLWLEQWVLPELVRSCRAEVLLSAGNFALRRSPVPQILLSRNSIYLSNDFYRDLRARGEYRIWIDTKLRGAVARRSIAWANVTVAPSEAFASDLRRWAGDEGRRIAAIHHGFDHEAFTRDQTPLTLEVEQKLQAAEASLKLLFVSHYNYYRNFETLIRALPTLRERLAGRSVKLLLTCKLTAGANPGTYNPVSAAALIRELGIRDLVVELGAIPYQQLHQVYRRADIYVTPAYTETFAHPLVEAMASGIPVVASDLPAHREICGEAALYFPRFSCDQLAARVLEASQPEVGARLSRGGIERSATFSWKKHVEELLALAESLLGAGK